MKITLTMDEVIVLVRNQYRFHDNDNIQIEIEGFGEVDTTDNNADGWISVPSDWKKRLSNSRSTSVLQNSGSTEKWRNY